MELDDLKNNWDDMTKQISTEHNLSTRVIDVVANNKYHSGLRKIITPEIAGIIICMMGVIFILLKFSFLDTLFFKLTGILSIIILFAVSLLSVISIFRLNREPDLNGPYAKTLRQFALQKIKFYKYQKINVTLCYLLLVTMIILFSKFFNNHDIIHNKFFWIFSFCLGYMFLLFYSKWVTKYYSHKLQQAENILKELSS